MPDSVFGMGFLPQKDGWAQLQALRAEAPSCTKNRPWQYAAAAAAAASDFGKQGEAFGCFFLKFVKKSICILNVHPELILNS